MSDQPARRATRVVLVNGVYGAPEHFDPLREALRPEFVTDVFSFRREGLPDPTPRSGFGPMVDRLARTVEAGGPRGPMAGESADRRPRPVLVGFSLGGALALEYVLERPEAVAALVLVNSFARYRRGAIQATSLPAIWSWPPAWSHPISTAHIIYGSPWLRRSLFCDDMPREAIERGVRAATAAVTQDDLRFQLAHLELPVPLDLPGRLAKLGERLPILLVSSRDDLVVPSRHTHWLARHMPAVRHLELDGGHAFFQHHAAGLADEVRTFVSTHRADPAAGGRTRP